MAHDRDQRYRSAWDEDRRRGGRGQRSGGREEWSSAPPRGYGAGQDETGWDSDRGESRLGRSYRDDRDREQSGWAGAGRGEYGGSGGLSYADRGDRSSGYRDRWSESPDWADRWRAGRGREYDQYTGMTSEPGFGSGYGAAGPHRYGGEYAGRRFDSSDYGYGSRSGERDPRYRDDRGMWDRATDEVSSLFGDEDAARRREQDRAHTGRGPRNYARSDARIHEDVCDRLTDDPMIDASDVEVHVSGREVTLDGHVDSRAAKRRAEDCAESVSGVTHVQNNLRVKNRTTEGRAGAMGMGVDTSSPDYTPVGSTSEGLGERRTSGVGTSTAGMSGAATAPKRGS